MLQPVKDSQAHLAILVASVFALAACTTSETCGVRESDEPVINRALDIYSKGKMNREQLRRSFNIAVVYLPKMTCVGLNAKAGTAGGDETICLDGNGNQVLYHVSGD